MLPNATVMVIYDADRFGLAQLHQLRGRVGRGGGKATCILVARSQSETGVERMRVMTDTADGFEIARRDLELRGPGDFFGVKQSGAPEFQSGGSDRRFSCVGGGPGGCGGSPGSSGLGSIPMRPSLCGR